MMRAMVAPWKWNVGRTLIMAGLLSACGGEDGPANLDPTIDNIQQFIFTPGCANSGCHDSIVRGGDLDLSTAQISYDAMVNVPSRNPVAKANGWIMVKPGDADRSFLIRKIEGPGVGEGDPMPSAAQTINPYYIELLREWIDMGAPR